MPPQTLLNNFLYRTAQPLGTRLCAPLTGLVKGFVSIGAMVLAFLAGQHHNLHMAFLTLGLGGSGMPFMAVYPGVRCGMLVMSLVVVAMNLRSIRRAPSAFSMRALVLRVSGLTLGFIVWSLIRFGL